jgi:hypothetical protein
MAVTFADYLQFMETSSVFPHLAKFEFLNPDETVYASFTSEVTGGNIAANRANGVRRSCSINVQNINDTFTPNPVSGIWVNQKFKLSLGYKINGEEYYIPQGTFGMSNPQNTHIKSQKDATISGVDKFGFLNGQLGGRFSSTYSIAAGTNVITSIKSVLIESAINDPITPLLLIDASATTPYTIYKEYGTTFSDLLLELNSILSYNMYYNLNGRFICEPDTLNSLKPPQWNFNTSSKVYLGITQDPNFDEAYNIVMVVGDNVNGNQALGIARNDDPSSPLSIMRIGEKLAPPITDAVISTDQQAIDRANWELRRYASLSINATITCIPLLHLDVDQIITVTDEDANLNNERFLINSLNIPLDPKSGQTMTITATKANDIDFEINNP